MSDPKAYKSIGSLLLLAALVSAGGMSVRSAGADDGPGLLDALRAGSRTAFRIASPIRIGDAVAFQNYNGDITLFPGAARSVQSQLAALYLRVNGETVLVEGTFQGVPLQADWRVNPNGSVSLGVENQTSNSNLSLRMIVQGNQVVGTYAYTSGLIIHAMGGSIASSSTTSYGGNFRSTLVPVPPQELPPLPPANLQVLDQKATDGRVLLSWRPGDAPAKVRGYVIYREIDFSMDRTRLGTVQGTRFVDDSEALHNAPALSSIVYSVVAIGTNGKESTPAWVQIFVQP